MSGRREEGVALVTVLVMVAVMSALAVLAVEAAGMSMRRTANQAEIEQARWYIAGAEQFAAGRILDLARRNAEAPVPQETWQGVPFTFPLDHGAMTITLWDGGNCFNLNSVVDRTEEGLLVASARGQVQFARLLDLIDLRDADPRLPQALADWIDSDERPLLGGAENESYGTVEQPYMTGGDLLADIGELRRIRGFTPEVIARLSPFVCVRPTPAPSTYNPNTLTLDQAPLLAMAIGPDLSLAAAGDVIRARPRGGWLDIDSFFLSPRFSSAQFTEPTRAQFSLTTNYYVVGMRVEHGAMSESGAALIDYRGAARVVRRVYGAGAEQRIL